jgi:hypothetical protein
MSLESDGGMMYWQGKTEELREKPVPVPLCPPQIPHGLTRARTRASTVRGQQLTTSALARPLSRGYWAKLWLGRDADHSPHLVLRSRMSKSYTSFLPWHLHGIVGCTRSLAEAKGFSSSPCVQTSYDAHPAFYPMVTRGKVWPGRDADHSPHLVLRSRMSRRHTSSPP